MLIGDEGERPYERPPLSKGYLLGKEDKAKLYVHEEGWYGENSVELLLGSPGDQLGPGGSRWSLQAATGSGTAS